MKKKQIIDIFVNEDPQISHVVLQLVTKAGQYLNMSGARYQVSEGNVMVDGRIITDLMTILEPGIHKVGVGSVMYDIDLHHAIME